MLLWDANTRRVVREISLGGACYGLSFSSDGESLAVVDIGTENAISIWRVSDGAAVASWPGGLSFGAYATPFATTPNLTLAANYGQSRTINVIDLKTGQVRCALASGGGVIGLALSPDGKILASAHGIAGVNSTIQLWEVATGREIGRLEGDRGRIGQLVFLPDGKQLVSASADHTLRLWDIGTRTAVRTFRGHKTEVWKVVLMPDQRTIVSGGKDGSVYSWDLHAERPVVRGQAATCNRRFFLHRLAIAFTPDRPPLAHLCERRRLLPALVRPEPRKMIPAARPSRRSVGEFSPSSTVAGFGLTPSRRRPNTSIRKVGSAEGDRSNLSPPSAR